MNIGINIGAGRKMDNLSFVLDQVRRFDVFTSMLGLRIKSVFEIDFLIQDFPSESEVLPSNVQYPPPDVAEFVKWIFLNFDSSSLSISKYDKYLLDFLIDWIKSIQSQGVVNQEAIQLVKENETREKRADLSQMIESVHIKAREFETANQDLTVDEEQLPNEDEDEFIANLLNTIEGSAEFASLLLNYNTFGIANKPQKLSGVFSLVQKLLNNWVEIYAYELDRRSYEDAKKVASGTSEPEEPDFFLRKELPPTELGNLQTFGNVVSFPVPVESTFLLDQPKAIEKAKTSQDSFLKDLTFPQQVATGQKFNTVLPNIENPNAPLVGISLQISEKSTIGPSKQLFYSLMGSFLEQLFVAENTRKTFERYAFATFFAKVTLQGNRILNNADLKAVTYSYFNSTFFPLKNAIPTLTKIPESLFNQSLYDAVVKLSDQGSQEQEKGFFITFWFDKNLIDFASFKNVENLQLTLHAEKDRVKIGLKNKAMTDLLLQESEPEFFNYLVNSQIALKKGNEIILVFDGPYLWQHPQKDQVFTIDQLLQLFQNVFLYKLFDGQVKNALNGPFNVPSLPQELEQKSFIQWQRENWIRDTIESYVLASKKPPLVPQVPPDKNKFLSSLLPWLRIKEPEQPYSLLSDADQRYYGTWIIETKGRLGAMFGNKETNANDSWLLTRFKFITYEELNEPGIIKAENVTTETSTYGKIPILCYDISENQFRWYLVESFVLQYLLEASTEEDIAKVRNYERQVGIFNEKAYRYMKSIYELYVLRMKKISQLMATVVYNLQEKINTENGKQQSLMLFLQIADSCTVMMQNFITEANNAIQGQFNKTVFTKMKQNTYPRLWEFVESTRKLRYEIDQSFDLLLDLYSKMEKSQPLVKKIAERFLTAASWVFRKSIGLLWNLGIEWSLSLGRKGIAAIVIFAFLVSPSIYFSRLGLTSSSLIAQSFYLGIGYFIGLVQILRNVTVVRRWLRMSLIGFIITMMKAGTFIYLPTAAFVQEISKKLFAVVSDAGIKQATSLLTFAQKFLTTVTKYLSVHAISFMSLLRKPDGEPNFEELTAHIDNLVKKIDPSKKQEFIKEIEVLYNEVNPTIPDQLFPDVKQQLVEKYGASVVSLAKILNLLIDYVIAPYLDFYVNGIFSMLSMFSGTMGGLVFAVDDLLPQAFFGNPTDAQTTLENVARSVNRKKYLFQAVADVKYTISNSMVTLVNQNPWLQIAENSLNTINAAAFDITSFAYDNLYSTLLLLVVSVSLYYAKQRYNSNKSEENFESVKSFWKTDHQQWERLRNTRIEFADQNGFKDLNQSYLNQ